MIKVCHVSSAHYSDDSRIINECVALAEKEEYEVSFVVRGKNELYKGVNIVGLEPPTGGRLKRLLDFSKKIYKKAVEVDADIYELHDPELLIYVKKLKKLGKKVIYDSHEDYYEQIKDKDYLPEYVRNIVAWLYRRYETKICSFLDGAIFPCPINGKHIFEGRVENIEYVNNVPLMEEGENIDVEKCRAKEVCACVVGSITPARGVEVLIDACYKADIRLIMAGPFESPEYEKYLKSKESFGIVDYRGVCSRKEVAEIYREAMVGTSTILPRGQYPKLMNLPTKVYEYMMCGMPFVISDFEYCRMVIDKYHCGICANTESVDEVAAAIKYLAEHKEEALQMGMNGRKAFLEEFNWDIEKQNLFRLYDNVLK